jgi:hypothetical protein
MEAQQPRSTTDRRQLSAQRVVSVPRADLAHHRQARQQSYQLYKYGQKLLRENRVDPLLPLLPPSEFLRPPDSSSPSDPATPTAERSREVSHDGAHKVSAPSHPLCWCHELSVYRVSRTEPYRVCRRWDQNSAACFVLGNVLTMKGLLIPDWTLPMDLTVLVVPDPPELEKAALCYLKVSDPNPNGFPVNPTMPSPRPSKSNRNTAPLARISS